MSGSDREAVPELVGFIDLDAGTTTDSATPVLVAGITNAQAVSVGGGTACAFLVAGKVRCRVLNGERQLWHERCFVLFDVTGRRA